jgi:hypothetical protein
MPPNNARCKTNSFSCLKENIKPKRSIVKPIGIFDRPKGIRKLEIMDIEFITPMKTILTNLNGE